MKKYYNHITISFNKSFLYCAFIASTILSPAYANLTKGTISNPSSSVSNTDDMMQGISYSGTTFVAITADESTYISTNGIDWTRNNKVFSSIESTEGISLPYVKGIVWTGTKFVVGVKRGRFLESTDGVNWTLHPADTSITCSTLAKLTLLSSGTLISACRGSTDILYYTSTDNGKNWTKISEHTNTNTVAHDDVEITVNGNIVVTSLADDSGVLWRSPDKGATWTKLPTTHKLIKAVAVNNSGVIAIVTSTAVEKSSDSGQTFSKITTGLSYTSNLIWTGSLFALSNIYGHIANSSDASTWKTDKLTGTGRTRSLGYGNSTLIAAQEVSLKTTFYYDTNLGSTAPSNIAPTANAGTDQTVTESTTVTLTGSGSDTDGSISTYLWEQLGTTPSITLNSTSSASSSFTAPAVTASTTVTLKLTVTDDDGVTGSDEVAITVNPSSSSNSAPTANAGTDQTVTESTTVTLTGSGSDTDGTISTYLWEQVGTTPSITLNSTSSASSSFTAPTVTASTTVTLKLTVTDNSSTTASDEVVITINPSSSSTTNTSSTSTSSSDSDKGFLGSFNWLTILSLLGLLSLTSKYRKKIHTK